jgi:predicted AAA+ superfamily ATPase
MLTDQCRVTAERLRWECDQQQLDFQTTADLPELVDTIGQERALRSINFSLGMMESGFNLFISGEAGTGRTSSIMALLKKRAKDEPAPHDWCYVHNFKDPDNPVTLAIKAGMGSELEQDMSELLNAVRSHIPKALESKDYENQKAAIMEAHQEKNNELFSSLEKESLEKGFALQRTVSGLVMVPQKEGRNFTQEEYEALPAAEQEAIDKVGNELRKS